MAGKESASDLVEPSASAVSDEHLGDSFQTNYDAKSSCLQAEEVRIMTIT